MSESGPMPLEGERKRYVRFEPTLNTGHVLQIVVFIATASAVYTGIKTDQVQQKADLENVKTVAQIDRTQTQQALTELKLSVNELQHNTNDIKESLAVLRGRAADTGSRK